MITPAEFIRAQKKLLEAIFQRGTLEDPHARHPAAVRWQMCVTMLRQGGVIRWPAQKAELPLMASMMLDASAFIRVSGRHLQALSLGDLTGYGDAAVRRKIESRLDDPRQFGDLMVELSLAAWHQFEGHSVTPFEKEGWPDLRVDFDSRDLPILIECKRVHVATPTRLAKHIQKANKQIRQVGIAAYGVVVLDLSAAFSEEPHHPSDELPSEISSLIPSVRAALSGPKHRSVGRVVLTWDDVGILGDPPDRTAVFLRRRLLHVDHEPMEGVHTLPDSARTFQGSTVFYSLDWDQSVVGIHTVRSSDLMAECRRWFSFTDEELIDAFAHHDKWQLIPVDASDHLILFARRSTVSGRPSFILALAGRAGSTLNLQFAIRIPPRLYEEMELLTSYEMLEHLIAEYGLEVTIGGLTDRFIPRHHFELSGDPQSAPLSQIKNEENHSLLYSMMLKINQRQGGYSVDCALVFALDRTKLESDLRV